MAPVLGYWDIRGCAEAIRCLLHYLDIEFEDRRYEFGPEPNYLDTKWKVEEPSLGLELPNLPYYIDGDLKLTQSLVIMRYLSQKNPDMYFPKGEYNQEIMRFETMEGHARDLCTALGFAAYSPSFEEYREFMCTRMGRKLKESADFLGENKWLFGDKISYVDFVFFEAVDALKLAYPGCCSGLDNLNGYLQRFAALPKVQKYRKDSKKWPLFSPFAYWGGKGELPVLEN